MEKDHKLVCVGKCPICIKCPPFLTFVLYPTKQVSSTAKNYVLLLSLNNPTEAGKFLMLLPIQITQEDISYYSQKQLLPGLLKKP